MESLGIDPNGKNADDTQNTQVNKNNKTDIICSSHAPYFPSTILGNVKERFIKNIDYIVGIKDFEQVFKELGFKNEDIDRENKIYSVINKELIKSIRVLSDDDINNISNYTNRVESSELYITIGFDWYVLKHLQQWHAQDILGDIKENIVHKFIELEYRKSNLILHLHPHKCMTEKSIPYDEALSYCISIMWATLINIINKKTESTDIIDLLKQVFQDLNPIATKIEIHSIRTLTPEGYSFIQELSQLTPIDKFIDIKTPSNRVIVRWSPRSDRFENYIYKAYRKNTADWDDIELKDVRGDSNGKRCLIYDCKIDKNSLITKITVVGQNIMRDVTGYYTTPIYGLLCDDEILEDYELSTLFRILTATKEHRKAFNLIQAYIDVKTGKVKFLTESDFHDESLEDLQDLTDADNPAGVTKDDILMDDSTIAPEVKKKTKHLKRLSDISIFKKEEEYTLSMVGLAVERLNKKVFRNLETNNDFYIATQLIERFNLKRNMPKDIMTVLKFAKLPDDKLNEKLNLVERHKRIKIKEMVEFVKTLEHLKHILHRLYNYLWIERYV